MLVLAGSVLSVSAVANAQPGAGNQLATVYFQDSVGSGAVALWVDGQRVIDSFFVGSLGTHGYPITVGQHDIVVTPFYATPGVKDVVRGRVNVSAGTSTLRVGNAASNANLSKGFKVNTLYFTAGAPN